MIKIL
jgi:hypothetical protein